MPVSLQISSRSGLSRAIVPPALVIIPITEQASSTISVTRTELPCALRLTKCLILFVNVVFTNAPPMMNRPYHVMIVVLAKPAHA